MRVPTARGPAPTADGQHDEGFTVVELMVSIGVLLVVMAVVTTGLVTAMQHQRRSIAQVDALNRTTVALERVTAAVRAADPIVVAEADGVEVTLADGGGTVQRTYRLVADGAGGQRLISCAGTYAACVAGAGSVLTNDVVNDAAAPLFTYLDGNGVDLGAPVAAVDVDRIKEVEVNPRVAFPEAPAPIDITNDVRVRNWSGS